MHSAVAVGLQIAQAVEEDREEEQQQAAGEPEDEEHLQRIAGVRQEPPEGDDEWPELPRTRPSLWSRFAGWTLLIGWAVAVAVFALWRFLAHAGDPLQVFLVLGLPGALLLLFLSVLFDRLRDLKTDRYRGVQR